jgi:hypothetical protein
MHRKRHFKKICFIVVLFVATLAHTLKASYAHRVTEPSTTPTRLSSAELGISNISTSAIQGEYPENLKTDYFHGKSKK